MITSRHADKARGFTLLELLISLTLIGLIMTVVFGTYLAITDYARRARPRSQQLRQAQRALQQMSRQLRCALPIFIPTEEKEGPRQAARSGQMASATEPLVSHFAGSKRGGVYELRFLSSALTPRQSSHVPQPNWIVYRYEPARGTLTCREYAYTPGQACPEERTAETKEIELLENLETFELAFYGGEDWQDKWPAAAKANLPAAVRIALGFRRADKRTESYETMVVLPGAQPFHPSVAVR